MMKIAPRGLLLRAPQLGLYKGIALLAMVVFHVEVIGAFTMLHRPTDG